MYDIYDLTAATAAFEAYMTGLADAYALMPYQGTKWRVRKELTSLVEQLGFSASEIDEVHLNDLGPWGMAWQSLLNPVSRPAIIQILVDSLKEDPKQLYDSMHGQLVPGNKVIASAQYLWLQRLSFGNKAVGIRNGRWASPGLNPSSAYGKPAVPGRFGAIRPMIPSLIARLRGYDWSAAERWSATQLPASADLVPRSRKKKLVFIDPPYRSRTKYPAGDLPRLDVAALGAEIAETRLRSGLVIITEAEPIPELIEAGWEQHRLSESRHSDGSPMKGKHEEWVTYLRV